jgi:hypothetical protein
MSGGPPRSKQRHNESHEVETSAGRRLRGVSGRLLERRVDVRGDGVWGRFARALQRSRGLLFLLALALAFKFPRAAAFCALVACLDSLPLYLDLVFPRPFRRLWPGQWYGWDLPRETFVWDGWWIMGIASAVFVASVCCWIPIRSLTVRSRAGVEPASPP